LVYAPLAKYLTNAAHLIICSDGQLGRVPLAMLPDSSSPTATEGDRFLIEEKTITYVGSGREIARLTGTQGNGAYRLRRRSNEAEPPTPPVHRGKAVVMGAPDFELDLSGARVAESAGSGPSSNPESLDKDFRDLTFKPLPETEVEARTIAGLLGDDTVLRLGKEARESALKALVSPRILHVATHGFFLSDQEFRQINGATRNSLLSRRITTQRQPGQDFDNPLVRCGIALAGANHALQVTNVLEEDGLVTGLEASQLKLQGTELVILSACESGSGEIRIGEGLMSLRRAFRIAGAEAVLASHWQVNDKATRQLMTTFINDWRSDKPRAQAWREAQLSLLHSKEFANPYFWAGFTLTGQWN
jgi:CHAT domain-containing protein